MAGDASVDGCFGAVVDVTALLGRGFCAYASLSEVVSVYCDNWEGLDLVIRSCIVSAGAVVLHDSASSDRLFLSGEPICNGSVVVDCVATAIEFGPPVSCGVVRVSDVAYAVCLVSNSWSCLVGTAANWACVNYSEYVPCSVESWEIHGGSASDLATFECMVT